MALNPVYQFLLLDTFSSLFFSKFSFFLTLFGFPFYLTVCSYSVSFTGSYSFPQILNIWVLQDAVLGPSSPELCTPLMIPLRLMGGAVFYYDVCLMYLLHFSSLFIVLPHTNHIRDVSFSRHLLYLIPLSGIFFW